MKILHRDIKCANIFLGLDENGQLLNKLGDLNVSKVAKQGKNSRIP
jgi:serine/threonine protein kinase